jgi:hypothetical protein
VQEAACDITKIDVEERARGPLRPSKMMISRHGIFIQTSQNNMRTRKNGRPQLLPGENFKSALCKDYGSDGEFYGKS